MASKKTATAAPKKFKIEPPPIQRRRAQGDCMHTGAGGFTSYGIPQPDNGEIYQVCLTCGKHRSLPDKRNPKPKTPKPVYVPPVIAGESVNLFDLSTIPMTKEAQEKERRKQELAKRKAAQAEINKQAEAQHNHK